MPHFFISYAKKDTRELAIALNDALNALPDVTAWVDRSLKAGASWETQIQREINKCDYFVVLYSPDLNRHLEDESLSESYVLTEIAYAKYTLKKAIIPVMAQKTNPPLSLTTAHYIDFTLKGLSLNDLLEAICDEAGIQLANSKRIGTISIPLAPKPTTKRSIKDILPQPFDWCEIPADRVILVNYQPSDWQVKAFNVDRFLMAKYPITNSQYAKFIEADGYTNKKWWTEVGWTQKEKDKWAEPRYWKDSKWNGTEQPVVGVSWYECIAFCLWLSEISGEKIMLPTEQQWQRAAQGDDERVYPWGNDWDANRCHNSVDGHRFTNTCSVRQYEGKGSSPYLVVDMSGNAWEWCLTGFETGNIVSDGTVICSLRGGSWKNQLTKDFRVSNRFGAVSFQWNSNLGFRIALNLE